MIFTLEALEAKHGDSLLLHFGTKQNPQFILIDGGPAGVYKSTLSKRLQALKQARSPQNPLAIRMVMVSHIDDDHINGILQFFKTLDDERQSGQQPSFAVATLWHNSFDDLLGNGADELTASLKAASIAAAHDAPMPPGLPINRDSALILANVPQGRDLRNLANALGLTVNEGFQRVVMVPDGQKGKQFDLAPELRLTVLGPHEDKLRNLQTEWDKQIKKLGLAKVAEFVDKSVFNLSSIIVLAESDDKRILLTGDARGDEILDGVKNAGLLNGGQLHVDILKLPHHGSDRNVSTDFFKTITADHYVCSGNGKYGNPEEAALQMILDARGTALYSIHLTNREPRLEALFQNDTRPGKQYRVVFRNDNDLSLSVQLAD